MKARFCGSLLSLTGVVALAAAAPAFSQVQDAAAAPETTPAITEVIITGSRIPQPNLTSASPIQVVTDQEIKLQGSTDMSQLINTLPQQLQNSVADFSNSTNPLTGPGGLTTADLRGLGPQRTLVLVDGRRLGVGDASTGNPNPAPDLDQIPTALVERIDVVTGGASAVYGSDAIAGVVNFVMKRNYEGIQVDAQYGFNEHHNHSSVMQGLISDAGFAQPSSTVTDGHNRSISLIMGTNSGDGKGNVTAYFTYLQMDPVSQGRRDFSACKLNVDPDPVSGVINQPSCNGSANSNRYVPTFNPDPNAAFSVVGNQLLPWPQDGSVPPALFNSSPYQYLSRGDLRYLAGFTAHYDLNEYVKPYAEFSYMNDRTAVQVGPSALFLGGNPFNVTGGMLINCDNPLLSAQELATLCGDPANAVNANNQVDVSVGRRNIEGGPRESDYEHNNYRGVFGIKGGFADAWTYDVYGQYYYTSLFQANKGYESYTKAQNALLVVTDPVSGAPVCQGGQTGCVPYNVWTQGGVTREQTAYLATLGTSYGTVNERIVSGNITGELGKYGIKSPMANDGVVVNVGVEHRTETLKYDPDEEERANDLAGLGGAVVSVDGSYHVQEEFLEARIPLIQQQPWIEDLDFHSAYRHSNYSSAGSVNTYAFDVQYAPTTDVRLRASFQRAIRAPNLIELFTPNSVTNTSIVGSDPCAGANPQSSLADCMHTGVSAAQYGHIQQCPASQCSTLTGGNTNLVPETANTLSFGATFTPSFVEGLTASVDYYKIILKQQITNVPLTTTLQQCLTTGDPIFCNNIVRTSIGTLFGTTVQNGGYIAGTSVNIAAAVASGVDLQLNYRYQLPAGFGKLSAGLAGTYMVHNDTQPTPTNSRYNCAGLYGPTCQTVSPRWRHNLRVNWETPYHVLLSAQWRFIGSVKLDTNTGNPALLDNSSPYGPGVFDSFDARLPNMSYLDLSARWDVNHMLSVRAGANNVLDKDPPLVSSLLAGTGSPNSYPTYDLVGRQLFIAFTANF
jgi:iron complex outermembrane receptor protein